MPFPPALLKSYCTAMERLEDGQTVVVSHTFLDWLSDANENLARRVRTIDNPERVGFEDRYLATLAPQRGTWDARLQDNGVV